MKPIGNTRHTQLFLLMFRKPINAETVMSDVEQLIRGTVFAVIKQYNHFRYITIVY